MPAKLFIIPSTLGDTASIETIPPATLTALQRLEHLIVETPKQARQFLRTAGIRLHERRISFYTLDEHTAAAEVARLLAPALSGSDIGLLSDAGCPAVADPGAALVRLAHERGIPVIPLVGPSSITLALMASGLNGQRFSFPGYLPVELKALKDSIRLLEHRASAENQTQVFIEAPYRNDRLFAAILDTCAPQLLLCLATDLTLTSQSIATRSVERWRTERPVLNRRPTVFLLGPPG